MFATYERPFKPQGETLAFTGARPLGVARQAAGARVHRRDNHAPRRQADAPGRARHQHLAVLDWHPQRLERRAVELGQLVHEEHATVGQRAGMSPEFAS